MMQQPKTLVAVLVLVLVGSVIFACGPKRPPGTSAPPQIKTSEPQSVQTSRYHHAVTITVAADGKCTAPDVKPSQGKKEFVTWNLAGSVSDTYSVIFDKGQGTPCDSGMDTLDIQGSQNESTACTIEKVKLYGAPHKEYKYSIYKAGDRSKCADPSVDVQP